MKLAIKKMKAGVRRLRDVIGLPLGSIYAGLIWGAGSFFVAQIVLFGIGFGYASSIRSAITLGLYCGGILGLIHGLRRYSRFRMSLLGVLVAVVCLIIQVIYSAWINRLLLMEAGSLLDRQVLISLFAYIGCSSLTGYMAPRLAHALTRPILWNRTDLDAVP
jgi:hypothetical protein